MKNLVLKCTYFQTSVLNLGAFLLSIQIPNILKEYGNKTVPGLFFIENLIKIAVLINFLTVSIKKWKFKSINGNIEIYGYFYGYTLSDRFCALISLKFLSQENKLYK